MFYGYGYGLRFDWTYLLLIGGFLLTLVVSGIMNSTFSKYSKVRSYSGLTGAQAAERILQAAGIYDVRIQHVSGRLSDHYDPRNKTLNLSDAVFNQTSIAAIGVAAHECGHAIQDAKEYGPLNLRSAIVPLANIGSTLSWPIFLFGLIFSMPFLLKAGIILFSAAVLFQLVTLPVEFNASNRALQMLERTGIMGNEEIHSTSKVLRAAAMTYVAALASSILQLLRLVILAGGRDND